MSVQPDQVVRAVVADRDPYSLAIAGLWDILEQNSRFTALVRPGNRIRFAGDDRDPIKEDVSTSDLPEVRIVVSASTPRAHRTSSSHSDLVRLEIQVSSGDQRIDAMHLPLKWAVFCAMADAEPKLRESVVWKGQNIVKLARAVTVNEGVSRADLNRGIIGWSAVWAVELELWFGRTTLDK